MWSSAILAWMHYLALALGLGGVFLRGHALKRLMKGEKVYDMLFHADNAWGIAAVAWIVTGLLRAFGPFEKGSQFYLHSPWFHLKLGLFGLVFLIELYPMVEFLRWRRKLKTQTVESFTPKKLKLFYRLNHIELALIGIIPLIAYAMTRAMPISL